MPKTLLHADSSLASLAQPNVLERIRALRQQSQSSQASASSPCWADPANASHPSQPDDPSCEIVVNPGAWHASTSQVPAEQRSGQSGQSRHATGLSGDQHEAPLLPAVSASIIASKSGAELAAQRRRVRQAVPGICVEPARPARASGPSRFVPHLGLLLPVAAATEAEAGGSSQGDGASQEEPSTLEKMKRSAKQHVVLERSDLPSLIMH